MTDATYSTRRIEGTRSFAPLAIDRLAEIGVQLMPWQAETLAEWLECDDDGQLTRGTAVLQVPRRNGKSLLVAVRMLIGALWLGEKRIIYSAHRADSASEMWRTLVAMAQHPKLAARVKAAMRAEGRERIIFDHGAEIHCRTRTAHGARGMEASTLVFDEALVLDEDMVAALTPLVAKASARGRGQVLYVSSAGTASSVVLGTLAEHGRELHDQSPAGFSYREWCAERTDDPSDPETWRKANPSIGTSILAESFLADARSRMSVESYGREHLGIWGTETALPVIEDEDWKALAATSKPKQAPESSTWMSLDLSPDYSSARVLLFYRTESKAIAVRCVDSVDDPSGIALDWYAQRVLSIAERHQPDAIAYDGMTGAMVASVLSNYGWTKRLRKITGTMAAAGVAALVAAVKTGTIVHDGHEALAGDLSRAVSKPWGDGGIVFARKGSTTGPITGAIALGGGMALASDELTA